MPDADKLKSLCRAVVEAAAETPRPLQSPSALDESVFHMPGHLQQAKYDHTVNIAVLGSPGAGTSSLVNALRFMSAKDPAAAPVGPVKTTMRPTAYEFCCEGQNEDVKDAVVHEDAVAKEGSGTSSGTAAGLAARVRLWDLPGVSGITSMKNACKDLGLLYYDAVVVVCARRVTQADKELVIELSRCNIPYLLVRTKIDIDVRSEESDHDLQEVETIELVRNGLSNQGLECAFLVSARSPERYELRRLLANLLASVKARRHPIEPHEDCCIVCGSFEPANVSYGCISCEARMCTECIALLSDNEEEARCPLCGNPSGIHGTWSWLFWWLPTWRGDWWTNWLWILT